MRFGLPQGDRSGFVLCGLISLFFFFFIPSPTTERTWGCARGIDNQRAHKMNNSALALAADMLIFPPHLAIISSPDRIRAGEALHHGLETGDAWKQGDVWKQGTSESVTST